MAPSINKNENLSPDIPDCAERDNATQQKINALKKIYCQKLNDSYNQVQTLKIGYDSNEKIYKSKERRFLSTRKNLNLYVNTEISMGSQLIQSNEKVKAGVANYKIWDDNLAKNLKDIFVAVKDLKTKITDLRDAAFKLENSTHDSCNDTQWDLVIDKGNDNGKDGQPHQKPPIEGEACKDAADARRHLFDMPRALLADVDAIFKSSSEIIGIQKFTNAGSLVALQQTLYSSSIDFDNFLINTATQRKTDLDLCQKELKEALKNRTGSVMDIYAQRCDYAGISKTLGKICCPKCGCVPHHGSNHCDPRLESCAAQICDICGEVKNAFTNDDTPAPPPPPPPPGQ